MQGVRPIFAATNPIVHSATPGQAECTIRTVSGDADAAENKESQGVRAWASAGTALAHLSSLFREECSMNLAIWTPVLLLLGLATFALMFAFVAGCDKV